MNIVFFGSGAFGLPTLRDLAARHTIRAVVTQPDKPAGRGGQLTPTPIGAWAAENLPATPLLKPQTCNTPEVRDAIRAFPADAWVVIAFGQKLGPALLADRFAVNLHASLLPRWRGAAPINAAVLAGDTRTGNSVITLADKMDAGLILGQSERPILPEQSAGELHDLLADDGPALVQRVLDQHAAGTLRPITQDESHVTLAPKIRREDAHLDFSCGAASCRNRIHGYNPWPGVTVTFDNAPLKVLRAACAAQTTTTPPGTLFNPELGLVSCGVGESLRLIEVQPAGKRAMAWSDFARGRRLEAGAVLNAGGRTTC